MNRSLSALLQKKRKIGLIFHDHVIRYADLKKGTLDDSRYGEVALEKGLIDAGKINDRGKLKAVLKKAIRKWKIGGAEVVFGVPDSGLILRMMDIQGNRNEDELRSYFVSELGTRIQLPFEDPVFDFHVIEQTPVITKTVLFVAPGELVDSYASLLRECGLKPMKADLSMLGLDRLIQSLDLPGRENHRMIIQLDSTSMIVSVFQEEIPLFTRYISLSPDDDSEEGFLKVANEVSRLLNFYQFTIQKGLHSVTSLALTGDHSEIESFHDAIESISGISVMPLYKEKLPNKKDEAIPAQYFTALGLALKPR